MILDPIKFKALADHQLLIPYGFGSKWDINDLAPKGPCDCSGAIRWIVHQATGIVVPDGSENQYLASRPLKPEEVVPFRAYGYFLVNGVSDHVFMLYDNEQIWNQEGEPWNRCLLRPREKFEAHPGFSGWKTFKALDDV